MQNRLQKKNLKSIAGYLLLNRLKIGKNLDYRHKYRFQFVEQIANPAEPDNGLTVDRAQTLGEEFCAEHFPVHQALICTHPDGHNHSGNIHVHVLQAVPSRHVLQNLSIL